MKNMIPILLTIEQVKITTGNKQHKDFIITYNHYKTMKKTFLIACVALTSFCTFAQESKTETEYRRSSLYTLMITDANITGDFGEIVKSTFDSIPIPDKYNDHCLETRFVNIDGITISDEDIAAVREDSGKKGGKKKFGGMMKKGLSSVASTATNGVVKMGADEDSVAAKLLKHLNTNHVGNQLLAKWYGMSEELKDGSHFNYDLIAERGLQSASREKMAAAESVKGGINKIMDNAAADLIPRTFVMVSSYSYVSAEDIINMVTQAANATGSMLGGKAGAITSLASSAGGAVLSQILKGYFVKTTSYLFQLDCTPEQLSEFEQKYWTSQDLTEFMNSDDYKLKYVGKTRDYAPATMKISTNSNDDKRLISRATVRATDGAISKLQKKYEAFRTLSTLHIDGETMYAYIGKKEGVKSGDKFEVLEQEMDEDGNIKFNKVGTVKVMKNKVWDNRAGAGEIIEGAATGQEDDDIDTSLTYTILDGKAKKFMEGMLLRQEK